MNIDHLTQKWTHSHEEDTADTVVYRPAAFAFPPSRGRRSFELNAGGGAFDYAIGRDDRPDAARGTWTLDPDGSLHMAWEGPPGRQTAMRVRSLAADKLVVSR